MKGLTNTIKHSLLGLSTTLTALLVGMTFALTTSVASAAVMIDINKVVFDINKVVIVKPHPVVNVMMPVKEAVAHPVVKEAVMPEMKSDAKVRQVKPFFGRPVVFNPFFDEELFGFEEE